MEGCCSCSWLRLLPSLLLLAQLPPGGSVEVGSAPQVYIRGPEEDGVRVVCTASGWFPKPQVQWRDLRGEKLLAFSETHAQDPEGLSRVETSLVVRDSSAGNVTCSILNPVLGQERTTAIFIPEPFFPQASLWKPTFVVSLTVLGLLLCGAGCFLKRERSSKLQELQKWKRVQLEKEEAQQAKEEVQKARDELQAALRERKAAYLAAWRKAQLYGGLSWMGPAVSVMAMSLDSHIVDRGWRPGPRGLKLTPGACVCMPKILGEERRRRDCSVAIPPGLAEGAVPGLGCHSGSTFCPS